MLIIVLYIFTFGNTVVFFCIKYFISFAAIGIAQPNFKSFAAFVGMAADCP